MIEAEYVSCCYPYPVDRKTYDTSIELLRKAINRAKRGLREKEEAMGRLDRMMER